MYKVFSGVLERAVPHLNQEYNNFLCNSVKYQIVRWKRKPWWLPTAKSKMFRIPQHKKLPEAESNELKRLWNHYRTEMKSISVYMSEKLQQSMTGEEVLAEQARLEEEDHINCLRLNDEWNNNVRLVREARIAKEKEKQAEEILRTLELNDKAQAERKAMVEAIVRQEKEKAKHYITSANIDAALEEALSKQADYNFAIDLECNMYQGTRSGPTEDQPLPLPEKVAQAN